MEDVALRLTARQSWVIKDAAHLPSLERPEEFNRVLLDFLTK
jgi:pimeloyl-ACP methyl ester carboxylesterase